METQLQLIVKCGQFGQEDAVFQEIQDLCNVISHSSGLLINSGLTMVSINQPKIFLAISNAYMCNWKQM